MDPIFIRAIIDGNYIDLAVKPNGDNNLRDTVAAILAFSSDFLHLPDDKVKIAGYDRDNDLGLSNCIKGKDIDMDDVVEGFYDGIGREFTAKDIREKSLNATLPYDLLTQPVDAKELEDVISKVLKSNNKR